MWQLICRQTDKKYIPPFVPSELNTYLGGDIINLINSFCIFIFIFPEIFIYLTLRWEMMSHFNENTKKSKPRCYFLSSVVLCIFLVCVVWMKEKFVAIILHHRQPLDSLNHHVWRRWILAASFSFILMFSGGICMPFLYISTHRSVQHGSICYISCFSRPHR